MTKPTHSDHPPVWTIALPSHVQPGDSLILIGPDGPIYERVVDEHGMGPAVEFTADELPGNTRIAEA